MIWKFLRVKLKRWLWTWRKRCSICVTQQMRSIRINTSILSSPWKIPKTRLFFLSIYGVHSYSIEMCGVKNEFILMVYCSQELCHQVLKGNIPSVKLIQLSQQEVKYCDVTNKLMLSQCIAFQFLTGIRCWSTVSDLYGEGIIPFFWGCGRTSYSSWESAECGHHAVTERNHSFSELMLSFLLD